MRRVEGGESYSDSPRAMSPQARSSPRPRSGLSNYSAEGEINPETSILVSKLPGGNQSTSDFTKTKRVTITTRSEFGPSTSYLNPHPPTPTITVDPSGSTHFHRMKQPQLINTCLDLNDSVRRLERQLEMKEEVLKRQQKQLDLKDRSLREKDSLMRKLELERIDEEPQFDASSSSMLMYSVDESALHSGSVRCRYSVSGCPYRLPSMDYHEDKECKFRPTRCPSLTCPVKPPYARLLQHVQDEHDGSFKGRDRICRNQSNHLVSSYVNIDKEPIFYKNTRMTWVANELVFDSRHFFLECMRNPPDWHLWVYLIGSEREAELYQTTIQLFREDEYGVGASKSAFSAQRSYTGQVISIHRSKEEIAEFSLGFQVHDKQIRPLCGSIAHNEEQLFGYEVSVYKKVH